MIEVDTGPIERQVANGGTPVLSFSGGKDSTACLEIVRPWWGDLTVVWVNTGDAFPETVEIMERVRKQVGRFVEVATDQPENVRENGWPSEIIPTTMTSIGRLLDGHRRPIVQPYFQCCGTNIWQPLAQAFKALGATMIIRGQKAADNRKAPLSSGVVLDGVEYWFPINDWENDEVFAYLEQQGVEIPSHYQRTETSLDCRHCTAYLYENVRKMAWLRDAHPDVHKELQYRLTVIKNAAEAELNCINRVLDA